MASDAETPEGARGDGEELRRDLGLLDAVSIMVGTMVGSGIFILPGVIAAEVPSPTLVIGVWIFAGLLIFFGALTLAELAAAMPESGGHYAFIREAFGQPWAFLNGWALFAANKTASIALLSVFFARYVDAFVAELAGLEYALTPDQVGGAVLGPWELKLVALALVAGLTVLNLAGVKRAGIVQSATTVAKIVALVILAVLGLTVVPAAPGAWETLAPPSGASLLTAIGVAMVPAFFAYDGWANAPQVGAEVRDPGRTLPRALVTGMILVTSLYVLVNLAYLRVLGTGTLAAAQFFPAVPIVEAVLGGAGRVILLLVVLVTLLSTTNAVVITGPRIYYAMARDGVFLESLADVDPESGTPNRAILLQSLWAGALVVFGTYGSLLNYIIIVSWVFFGLTAAGVFVLRRKRPNMERPYEVWGYPWVPAIFVLLAGAFVVNSLVTITGDSLRGLLLVGAGLPLYWYWTTGHPLPGWMREALGRSDGEEVRPWPDEGGGLTRQERGLLEYLSDIERHGAVFDATEAGEALGVSEAAVYQALSGLREKRPDALDVGYWGGDLHVRVTGEADVP
jgi:APA family basic amino acid/polyamine antiporter